MDQRTQFLLQLLQKLGAPLMGAVNAHVSASNEAAAAQTMAALLSESVKIGIALSQSMNLKPADGDADAIRVSLAALAGGLVAESYRQTGRVPGEAESVRIQKSLEAVIVFADNFAPAAQHAQRLQTLDSSPPFFDPVQTNIYTIHALLPVISAISEFSFGQDSTRLAQEVAERLRARAKEIEGRMTPSGDAMGELVALQALANLYASAHRAETARLKNSGDGSAASIDSVWKSFEGQTAMVDVLLDSMGGKGGSVSAGGGSGGVKPAVAEAQPIETPAVPPPPTAPETPPATAASASAAQGGNPMSFFKKK